MKTICALESRPLSLPIDRDCGIGWRRGSAVWSISVLLHASLAVAFGLIRLAPISVEENAFPGDPREIEFEEVEPDPIVEAPTEVADQPEAESTPDFAEATPTPTPNPVETLKARTVPRSALRPRSVANSRFGGGLAEARNTPTGWSTPKPVYPYQARRLRRQGSGGVRVTTNKSGRVVLAEMMPGIDPMLDFIAVNFARTTWTGPPNATRIIAITFQLE